MGGRNSVKAHIGLGANLGNAADAFRAALAAINTLPETAVRAVSSLYQTAPLEIEDGDAGDDYLNAVAEVETTLTAPELLSHLLRLELQAGRERPYRHAPRTLDLDLLMYGSAQMASQQLMLPHPRMMQRAFVLVPLAEIAPGLVSAAQLQAVSGQAIKQAGKLQPA
ncbi:MAG: 2-amino-4-hydroxy-6-hydroxymethyldihydropteridine diphosphokinase [Pseudomonadota bacterium]